jgi:hypothetical protein
MGGTGGKRRLSVPGVGFTRLAADSPELAHPRGLPGEALISLMPVEPRFSVVERHQRLPSVTDNAKSTLNHMV